jgi:hypothetical protein
LARRIRPIGQLKTTISILIANRRYRQWRQQHPHGTYGQFYADSLIARLDAGIAHRTLGKRQYAKDEDRQTGAWTANSFEERGKDQVALLRRHGLKPTDRCVDYGCGSLRLGQHLMRLLPPGHYYGLDVADRFFRDGLSLIDPAVISTSKPELGVIGGELYQRLTQSPPDFLFSYAVLKHVPPDELTIYFDSLTRLLGAHSLACIFFRAGNQEQRLSSMSWLHDGEALLRMIRTRYPQLTASLRAFDGEANLVATSDNHSVLILAGSDRAHLIS